MTPPPLGRSDPPAPIDCDTAVRRPWDHLDGDLPRSTRDEVETHLAACPLCTPHFAFARVMQGALTASAPRPISDRERRQIRARVEATLGSVAFERPQCTPSPPSPRRNMQTLAILALLEAKPGKEADVEAFLQSALPMVQAEAGTVGWYTLRLGTSSFAIFDTFADLEGREAHLSGEIAQALFARAEELLAEQPVVEQAEILAVKAPAT
jgi:quinol monooxygenase YgiN